MARYAIGHVQGCFLSLLALLEAIDFHQDRDQLWLAGDLVNRGPRSLETLEWAYKHRDSVNVVLGNHDLHLIARFAGTRPAKSRDTLDALLTHPKAGSLVEWLRHQALLVELDDYWIVHAGIDPRWDDNTARAKASALQATLQSPQHPEFLRDFFATSDTEKKGLCDDLRAFTLMRICGPDGAPQLSFNQTLADVPEGAYPWYLWPGRQPTKAIVFGHWAAHGFLKTEVATCLDSGCVWGKQLTAMNLDTRVATQIDYCD